MAVAVLIDHLTKNYGAVKALDEITFKVQEGELFGLIGPDGSGKTTLYRILTTLLLPDSGRAQIKGIDVVKDFKKIRKILGYMPGKFSLYQDLTVEENLQFFASIFNASIKENYHLVEKIYSQLEPFKDRRAGKLSGGMKQKLALSCALIHKPEVLILDEPTTGVDAVSRVEFWEMLRELKMSGITILVSTPYMDEASLCDRIGLIQEGSLLGEDTPDKIISGFKDVLFKVITDKMYELLEDLNGYEHTVSAFRFGEGVHLTLKQEQINTPDIENYLSNLGHRSIAIHRIAPSVEDAFMALMKTSHDRE